MSTIVIMPGGFHPFHAGHAALYQSAIKAFPGAEVFVAASNDTKTRPFPFAIKEKLAKLAGVKPGHFVQVKSPFQPKEITSNFNPEQDVVIFVRSEKDRNESPKPGGTKKDGTPAYFQPWTGKNVQPFGNHAYMAYLPTVEFGPGITSATEIRNAWPKLDDRRKTAMVMSLYPVTQKNPKLAANVVKMLDMGMGEQQNVTEGSLNEFVPPSSDRGDGGDGRSRRIRKLLEIAIQVAKQKNVDELGMIHAMNMIAGDEFFNTAVEGILPDITDKEYMFVLQSAYKTVKQGLAEGWFNNVKNKIKDSISDEKIIPMNINDLLIKVKNNDLNDMSGDSMAVNNIVRWAERTQNSEIIELMDSVKMYLDTFDNAPQWASWTGKKNTDINKLRELVSLLTQLKLKATEYFSKNQGVTEGWKTGAALGGIAGGIAGGPIGAAAGAGLGAIVGGFRSVSKKQRELEQMPGFAKHKSQALKYVLDKLPKTKYGELVMSANPALMSFNIHNYDNLIQRELVPQYFENVYGEEKGSYLVDNNRLLLNGIANTISTDIRWIIFINKGPKYRQSRIDTIEELLGNDPKYLKYFGITQPDEFDDITEQGLAETINSAILNKKFKHKQVIGDYTYTATAEDFEGSPLLWIKAYHGNKEIGHILFEIIVRSPGGKRKPSADYIESGGTEVDPAYRDKGVASTMYAYAKMLGNDIQASYNQTSQGKAMWKAWEKAGDAKHLVGTSMESTVKINEFAPLGSDDREPDEEEILRQLAAQWWNGTEQQMKKAQQTLQAMGWEIGQDESGDDDAGVFVIRIGDEHGDSYIAFNHSDLSLDENMGLPYPATYEEENQIRKNGPMRITAMTSESNLSESLDYLEEK